MKKIDTYLTRDETRIMKGIAILLMMMHHLWTFPARIAGGGLKYIIVVAQVPLISSVGSFGKICVSFFFFLGGYGIYHKYYRKSFSPISILKNIYFSYWKVFLIFVPIGYLLFSAQPAYCENVSIYSRFSQFSLMRCVLNLLGIESSINNEWWFLRSYVIAILTFPIIRGVVERFSLKVNIFLVVIGNILVTDVFPSIGNMESIGVLNKNSLYVSLFCQSAPYIACFWMGVVTAKDRCLDRLEEELRAVNLLNPMFDILICGVVFFMRQFTGYGANWDIFYLPVLIVSSIDLLRRTKMIRYCFLQIGKQSTNMWLIHSFFCYYFYAAVKIVTATRWAIPSLITLSVLSYAASVAVTYIWRKLGSFIFFRGIAKDKCC